MVRLEKIKECKGDRSMESYKQEFIEFSVCIHFEGSKSIFDS